MLIRGLPLFAGIAPVVAVALAYWLGVNNGALPSCQPLLDGCTSISATGRYPPGDLLFRAVMLPQAVVLACLWFFAAHWLRALAPNRKAAAAIMLSGIVGALALVLYVTFLGTRAPFYEFMRRFGIYFYFLGTSVAQLTLAVALLKYASSRGANSLKRLASSMLFVCSMPLVLGVLNIVLKNLLDDADLVENRIEWIAALLMQVYFVLLYRAWGVSKFTVEVKAG